MGRGSVAVTVDPRGVVRQGFTLIELCFVLAILALLVGVAVPAHEAIYRRAQASEAEAVLSAMAHAELQHYRDHGYYLACPAEGPVPRAAVAFPSQSPCWKALQVQLSDPVRYRYAASLDGDSFKLTAEADLDADGVASRFELDGRTLHVSASNRLE